MSQKLYLIGIFLSISITAVGQPVFKGGQRALTSFINNNQIYPEFSKSNCLQGLVQVRFRLDKEGQIVNSEIQKGFGTDLDIEALRVVRLTSGKWITPAGYDTLTFLVLPVSFSLREFKCEEIPSEQKSAAINSWHAKQGLTQGILNFYDKKFTGDYDPADEVRILELKMQLGYNEHFFDQLLKQGKTKLKQGDKEGACEDFQTIRRLGSDLSADMIKSNCQ